MKFKLISKYGQHIAYIDEKYALDMMVLCELAMLGYHVEAII